MKHVIALMVCLGVALPATAQTDPVPSPGDDIREGADLLGEGARKLLRGLMDGVEPTLRDLQRNMEDLDWQGLTPGELLHYHPPELLPNGDIILRRKEPRPLPPIPEGPQIDI